MKQIFFLVVLIISIISFAEAQSRPLSSTLFLQQDKGEEESYQCIQIRRGDIIALTGSIEIVNNDIEADLNNLYFTSAGGRTFLLKGEHIKDLSDFILTREENIIITLKGIVLFEGLDDMPAELEVTDYTNSD